jgi:hypothetical protein
MKAPHLMSPDERRPYIEAQIDEAKFYVKHYRDLSNARGYSDTQKTEFAAVLEKWRKELTRLENLIKLICLW